MIEFSWVASLMFCILKQNGTLEMFFFAFNISAQGMFFMTGKAEVLYVPPLYCVSSWKFLKIRGRMEETLPLSKFNPLFFNDLDPGQCFPLQQRTVHTFVLSHSTFQFYLLLHLMRLLLCQSSVQPEWVLWMLLGTWRALKRKENRGQPFYFSCPPQIWQERFKQRRLSISKYIQQKTKQNGGTMCR